MNRPSIASRLSFLALAAMVTLAALTSVAGIADRQYDDAHIAASGNGSPLAAATARQPRS